MPSNLSGLALGNGIPTWISKEHKNTNQLGVWNNHTHARQVPGTSYTWI